MNMKKTIEILVPAACSVAPGSAWADESTIKKSGTVIPALIRATAEELCETLGSPRRVRIGPEVRFRRGGVQFLVVLDFENDDVDINFQAIKREVEARLSSIVELEDVAEGHVAASGKADEILEGGRSPTTGIADVSAEPGVELDVDMEIKAAAQGEEEHSAQVLIPIDLASEESLMLDEVAETCERVTGCSLAGHGFPMALIRSAAGSEAFAVGRNLSGEMYGVHVKSGGLWMLEKVTITE